MKVFLAMAGMLVALSPSWAGTLVFLGPDTSRAADVSFLRSGEEVSGYAGFQNGTYDGIDISPLICLDLYTTVYIGENNESTIVAPRAARHEDRAAWLFSDLLGSISTPDQGAALQLAVWDIIHDNGDGVSAGAVQASSATSSSVVSLWNSYLALSSGQSSSDASVFLNTRTLTGEPAQPLMSTTVLAPEPGTFLGGAFAIAAILLGRRRRKPEQV